VDTGAMYRAVAWKAAHDGLPLDDDGQVSALARRARYEQVDGRILIDGHEVTREIRTPEIDKAAASVARLPQVREVLVGQQRALGAGGGVVMEGRDIGTVVFPQADLKFYIDASAEERARRRAADPAHTGSQAGLANVQSDMMARDKSDSTRAVAPLSMAPGAIYVDTTTMPIDAVVHHVMMLIAEKLE
jgi:cytidylate kinase